MSQALWRERFLVSSLVLLVLVLLFSPFCLKWSGVCFSCNLSVSMRLSLRVILQQRNAKRSGKLDSASFLGIQLWWRMLVDLLDLYILRLRSSFAKLFAKWNEFCGASVFVWLSVEEILDYLSMFQASETMQSGDQPVCHPLDMVLNFFKDEATALETTTKLRNFLQEALSIHSMRFEQAPNPEAWWNRIVFYCWRVWFDFIYTFFKFFQVNTP